MKQMKQRMVGISEAAWTRLEQVRRWWGLPNIGDALEKAVEDGSSLVFYQEYPNHKAWEKSQAAQARKEKAWLKARQAPRIRWTTKPKVIGKVVSAKGDTAHLEVAKPALPIIQGLLQMVNGKLSGVKAK